MAEDHVAERHCLRGRAARVAEQIARVVQMKARGHSARGIAEAETMLANFEQTLALAWTPSRYPMGQSISSGSTTAGGQDGE
jgi:hypothetical protein